MSALDTALPRASRLAVHRRVALAMVVVPALGTLAALVMAWHVGWPGAVALWLFLAFYLASAIGVEIGFHRYFTHRAFKCGPTLRLVLAAFGSMAGEGPVLFWAATHRRHHSHSDTDQDPHGPNQPGFAGFWRAHVGWLFEPQPQDAGRYVPDLIRDRTTSLANRFYLLWFALGLALPTAIGFAFDGGRGALEGLLWGGMVRISWRIRRPGASIRCAICSARGPTTRMMTAAISGRWCCRRWAGHGTTTTTPSRARPSTISPGGRSTRRPGSSDWRPRSDSCGTCASRSPEPCRETKWHERVRHDHHGRI